MPARPTSDRREFLQGRAAAKAHRRRGRAFRASCRYHETDVAASPSAGHGERYLVQYSRPAMACQFAVFLNAGQYSQAAEAALAALDLVERLEGQLTRLS